MLLFDADELWSLAIRVWASERTVLKEGMWVDTDYSFGRRRSLKPTRERREYEKVYFTWTPEAISVLATVHPFHNEQFKIIRDKLICLKTGTERQEEELHKKIFKAIVDATFEDPKTPWVIRLTEDQPGWVLQILNEWKAPKPPAYEE
jgi:hypothetical protein